MFKKEKKLTVRSVNKNTLIIPQAFACHGSYKAVVLSNDTAKAIWGLIDGKKSVGAIVDKLAEEFEVDCDDVLKEVISFMEKLQINRMIYKVNSRRAYGK